MPRLPVRLVARLLSRRRLITIPDLFTSATSVEVHIGGQLEAVGAPAELTQEVGQEHGDHNAACLLLVVQGLAAGRSRVDLASCRHLVAHPLNGLFHVVLREAP